MHSGVALSSVLLWWDAVSLGEMFRVLGRMSLPLKCQELFTERHSVTFEKDRHPQSENVWDKWCIRNVTHIVCQWHFFLNLREMLRWLNSREQMCKDSCTFVYISRLVVCYLHKLKKKKKSSALCKAVTQRLYWSRGSVLALWYPSSRIRTWPKPSDF